METVGTLEENHPPSTLPDAAPLHDLAPGSGVGAHDSGALGGRQVDPASVSELSDSAEHVASIDEPRPKLSQSPPTLASVFEWLGVLDFFNNREKAILLTHLLLVDAA